MASVETEDEARLAVACGWRYFRVKRASDRPLPNEHTCPASAEGGHRTTCERCGLCNGTRKPRAPNVVINAHGGLFVMLSWNKERS